MQFMHLQMAPRIVRMGAEGGVYDVSELIEGMKMKASLPSARGAFEGLEDAFIELHTALESALTLVKQFTGRSYVIRLIFHGTHRKQRA